MKLYIRVIVIIGFFGIVGIAIGDDCPQKPCGSCLYQPAFTMDDLLRGPAEAWEPQPGEIFLATDQKLAWRIGHRVALIGPPHHSGIIFRHPDGRMFVLESGPFMSEFVEVNEVVDQIRKYAVDEKVWIRRRKTPLTCEQSERLTEFCMAQDHKRFAMGRILIQLTPFRPRGPVKTCFMGKPKGPNRIGWICSELVMESLVYSGLADPKTSRPSPTSPRDLFFGRSRNLYINAHLQINCSWYAPARWTECP